MSCHQKKLSSIKKMGRWRSAALDALADWRFQFCITGCEKFLDPLMHFYAVVLQKHNPSEHCSLARIVCGKARAILSELQSLCSSSAWGDLIGAFVPSPQRLRVASVLRSGAVRLVAAFHQRIITRVESQPLELLWLAWAQPHIQDSKRKEVAERLLGARWNMLHITARKVRQVFKVELESIIACDGAIPMNLFAPMFMLAQRWSAHTAELEGVNNMVKGILAVAPRVSLAFVDAQIGNRKDAS